MALIASFNTADARGAPNAYVRLSELRVDWDSDTVRMTLQVFADEASRRCGKLEIRGVEIDNLNVTVPFIRDQTFNEVVTTAYVAVKARPQFAEAVDA